MCLLLPIKKLVNIHSWIFPKQLHDNPTFLLKGKHYNVNSQWSFMDSSDVDRAYKGAIEKYRFQSVF